MQEVLDRRRAQREREQDLQKAAERRLRLRRLSRDPVLSHDRSAVRYVWADSAQGVKICDRPLLDA